MRKLLWALLISTPLMSQVSNPSIISVSVAPSGACTAGLPNQQVATTGVQYSCQNGTWGAVNGGSGGSGTVNSGTTGQVAYYAADGTAVSGNPVTADSLGNFNSPGFASEDSMPLAGGVSTIPGGYRCFGDSNTLGFGLPSPTSQGYCYLINADINGGAFNNYAVDGDDAADMSVRVFTNAAPTDSGNPVTTTMIGTNDVNFGSTTAPYQTQFTQNQIASHTRLAISQTNVLAAQTAFTPSGTCTNDSTFTANPAIITATSCTLTDSTVYVGPTGTFYLWFYGYTSSAGTIAVTVDGVAATDTITGLSTLSAQMGGLAPRNAGTTSILAARYTGYSQGTHSIVVTMTGTTGVLGLALAPRTRNRGLTGPNVFFGGVPYKQNNSPDTSVRNAWSLAAAKQLLLDGLNVRWVDVRSGLDYVLGMTSTNVQGCLGTSAAGSHFNTCGHRGVANVFEDAMKNPKSVASASLGGSVGFWGITVYEPMSTGSGQVISSSATSVYVHIFSLPTPATISKVTWNQTAGTIGDVMDFGILNSSGAVVAQTGGTTLAAATGVVTHALTGTVTLQPGVYYMFWTVSNTSDAVGGLGASGTLGPVQNANSHKTGVCGNTTSGGTVSAGYTCGTISGTTTVIPFVYFE